MAKKLPHEAVDELREKLALGTRLLAKHGLIAPFGHPSVRIPGTDKVCVLSHPFERGSDDLEQTSADDIVVIDLDGNLLEGSIRAPGERFIHTQMYRHRSDVGAVVHAHPFACIALSTVGQGVQPIWNHATVFASGVPIFEEAVQIDSDLLGERVANELGASRAILLKGHGTVSVGRKLEEACVDSIYLERTAHMQLQAATLGTPQSIPQAQLTEESFTHGITGEGYYSVMWEYLTRGV